MEIMNILWIGAALLFLVVLPDRSGFARQDDCIVDWDNNDWHEAAGSLHLRQEHQHP